MSLVRVTAPSIQLLSPDEIRLHLKLDDDTDDNDLIVALGQAAYEHAEAVTGQAWLAQQWRLSLDRFPCEDVITLGHPAATTLESATYVDSAGSPISFTDLVTLDGDAFPSRLVRNYGVAWPSPRVQRNAIVISYNVGAADPDDVPESVKAAMKLMIGHWYENREAVNIGNITTELPLAVDALLAPHRVVQIA